MGGSKSNEVGGAVEYTTYPGCARKFFRCQPYSAVLSVEACAERFTRAQTAERDKLDPVQHCRACAIGARHAGVSAPFYSWLYQSPICPRCGKGTTRMIGNRKCVSCYHRTRELKAGKNAKGTPPINLKPLRPMRVACTVDGVPVIFKTAAVDGIEVMAAVSRVTKGRIIFSWQSPAFANAPVRSLDAVSKLPKSKPAIAA